MSADQWRVCPRCVERERAEYERRLVVASDAYGREPAEEYNRLQEEALAARPTKVPFDLEGDGATVRVNYETYFSGGALCFSYEAWCIRADCDWKMRVREAWLVPE